MDTLIRRGTFIHLLLGATVTPCLITLLLLLADNESVVKFSPDDAFYYFNVGKYLATEGKFSFDGLTLTTGVHPLYTGLLAALHYFLEPSPSLYLHLTYLFNGFLYLGTLLLSYGIGARVASRKGGLLMLFVFLTTPRLALYALSGMEATLNVFSIVLFLYFLVRCFVYEESSSRPLLSVVGLSLGSVLVALSRTENILFVLVALLVLVFLRADISKTKRALLIAPSILLSTISTVAWFVLCHQVTGHWMQSSAEMKGIFREMETEGFSPLGTILYSLDHFIEFAGKSILGVPSFKYFLLTGALLLFFRSSKLAMKEKIVVGMALLVPLSYGLIFASRLPGIHSWYLGISIVSLAFSSGYMLIRLIEEDALQRFRKYLLPIAILVLAEGTITPVVSILKKYANSRDESIIIAQQVLSELPADSIIGAWNSGVFGFFSKHPVINLDGLVNAEIVDAYRNKKLNWPYWKDRGLTHLIDDERWFVNIPDCFSGKCIEKVYEHPIPNKNSIVLYQIIDERLGSLSKTSS